MRKTTETQAGSDFVFLFYTSGERAPGDRGTDPPSQERRHPPPLRSAEQAEPPSLQAARPTSGPPCLILRPWDRGWQRGLEVWGRVGVGVRVRHMSRGGLGRVRSRLSVCSRLTGSCWENAGNPVSPARRAGRCAPMRGRCVRWMGGQGDHPLTAPLAPVGSGGRLLSGSSLSQDCARRVRLGFRGAVRRPGSGGPAMTVKAGLACEWGSQAGCSPRPWLLAVCHSSCAQEGTWGWGSSKAPEVPHSPSSQVAHLGSQAPLGLAVSPASAGVCSFLRLHPQSRPPLGPLAPVGAGGPWAQPWAWGASELMEGPAVGKEGGGWVS